VSDERYVLLGLAPARAGWFRDLTRWTTAAALPAELVKCVSVEEVRARLASRRRWSMLLVDAAAAGFDRDLVDVAAAARTPVVAVGTPPTRSGQLDGLGVVAVLPAGFDADALLDVLDTHARPVPRGEQLPGPFAESDPPLWRGRLVAVCGGGGVGTSVVAMAAAQGLGGDARHGQRVLLADLALRADQAMLHGAGEVVEGLQELVEACRLERPGPDEVAAFTVAVPGRGYRLLSGLRRPAAWAALRPRAVDAALDALVQSYPVVVADLTGDLEGEADSGSLEVEERNHLARSCVGRADAVLAVGNPGLKGVATLAWLLRALAGVGCEAARVLPVLNRAPRDPRARAEIAAALARIAPGTTGAAGPLWLREAKVETALRDGRPLPANLTDPLAGAISALLGRLEPLTPARAAPTPLLPGSFGAWSGEAPL